VHGTGTKCTKTLKREPPLPIFIVESSYSLFKQRQLVELLFLLLDLSDRKQRIMDNMLDILRVETVFPKATIILPCDWPLSGQDDPLVSTLSTLLTTQFRVITIDVSKNHLLEYVSVQLLARCLDQADTANARLRLLGATATQKAVLHVRRLLNRFDWTPQATFHLSLEKSATTARSTASPPFSRIQMEPLGRLHRNDSTPATTTSTSLRLLLTALRWAGLQSIAFSRPLSSQQHDTPACEGQRPCQYPRT
jgi:hypothetical protein